MDQMKWQPIETAPRDGTDVLLSVTYVTKPPVVGEGYFDPETREWWWAGSGPNDKPYQPIRQETNCAISHWMPLPPPYSA